MKTNIIAVLIFSTIGIISARSQNSEVNKINFYYLPWELKTQYNISEKDVRNFNKGRNMSFAIDNDTIIDKIWGSLSLLNLKKYGKDTNIDTRMVIDFCYKNGEIKTITLSTLKLILYDKTLYYPDYQLLKLLEMFLPQAKY